MLTFVEDDAHADETPEFRGRMIDRAKFDRLLAENAAKAGADCRYGVTVLKIDADGTLHTTDGEAFKPKVLIGADGPRSRVGRAIGQINRELVETRQVTVPLVLPHDATDIFLSADYRGGYGWLFPKGAVANVGLGISVDGALEDDKSTRRGLKAMLFDLLDRLAGERRIGTNGWALTGGAIPVGGRLQSIGKLGDTRGAAGGRRRRPHQSGHRCRHCLCGAIRHHGGQGGGGLSCAAAMPRSTITRKSWAIFSTPRSIAPCGAAAKCWPAMTTAAGRTPARWKTAGSARRATGAPNRKRKRQVEERTP